jgi:hypothetical protein
MGKKMLVSLALEGKLANHGLTAMEEDDDVLTALARELVTEKGIGECAAAVWKTLKQQHSHHPAASARLVSAAAAEEASLLVPVARPTPTPTAVTSERAQQLAFAF